MSTEEVMESANQFIESMTEAKAEVTMAHIRVVEIEDAIEEAVAARDFTKAAKLQEELLPVQKEYEEKKKKFQEACEDKESVVTAKGKRDFVCGGRFLVLELSRLCVRLCLESSVCMCVSKSSINLCRKINVSLISRLLHFSLNQCPFQSISRTNVWFISQFS